MSIDTSKVADSNRDDAGHREQARQGRRGRHLGRRASRPGQRSRRRTCARSSPTTGRSCSARSRCGASWSCCSPASSSRCGSTRAWARSPTTAPTPSCAASRCPRPTPRRLNISFDVRGGLLMRQMHHWAAMLFVAAMMVHLLRVFFTGAFRKPRELNWVIGSLLLLLGTLEGFTGYSLPDDLLSGTGVRAADGFMKSIPVVGTYMSFFLFGGEFPGRVDHPAPLHRPRPADPRPAAGADRRPHAAARLPQAHAVARPRPHRAERRRLPDAAGLHGQGRWVLLHRVRRRPP